MAGYNYGNMNGTKASQYQMEKMLTFMEQHSEIAHGKGLGVIDRATFQKLWDTLTNMLNSDISGPKKHPMKWQKTWVDWKSNTKKKYMKIKNRTRGTDGLPVVPQSLSKVEERLIALLYPESLEEDALLQEAELHSSENEILVDISDEKEEQYVLMEHIPVVENEGNDRSSEMCTAVIDESKNDWVHSVDLHDVTEAKVENRKDSEADLNVRKLLLKEKAMRDRERRTDILERAVREKERRSDILDSVLKDKERRTDLYSKRVRDHERRTDAFCKAVRDMERRTDIFNRVSTDLFTLLKACNGSLSLNKSTHR